MRKKLKIASLLIAAVMLLASYLPASAADKPTLFISEVCFNPDGDDVFEYIEFVNISDQDVNLTGATVTSGSKVNQLCTAGSGSVKPGAVAVIMIYQQSAADLGYTYNTAEAIDALRAGFNTTFSSSVSAECFFVAQKAVSGGGSNHDNSFNLGNSATTTLKILDASSTELGSVTYTPKTYSKSDNHSVGFGLSETEGNRCMGLTKCTPGIAYEELYTPVTGNFTEEIKVMTYNICASGVASDTVTTDTAVSERIPDASLYIANRYDEVLGLVTQENADIVCLNEVNGEWWKYISVSLCGNNGKYGYVSNTGNGHKLSVNLTDKWDTAPLLLYDKAKYELIEEGYFFCPADSRGIRTVNNWAILRNKTTGAEFMFMTQHLSAYSSDVRDASAEFVVNKIPEIAGDLPVIIMGDYNASEGSATYSSFIDNGYNDSSRMNPDGTFYGTFPGWVPDRDLNKRLPIDLIMISENDFSVSSYKVITEDKYESGYTYSDHSPVVAELKMRNVSDVPFTLKTGTKHRIGNGYFYCNGEDLTVEEVLADAFANPSLYETAAAGIMGTGNKIYLKDDKSQQLTVVVKGDVNGDGKISTNDYIKIKKSFLGQLTLEGEWFEAGDVNGDGKINTNDYVKIKKHFSKVINLFA